MDILSLGEKIKRLRKERNMTLKELAGDRITAAQISHIERDKSHTSHELLEYLSQQLEVSIDYLLETKEMQSRKITDNLILQSEVFIKCNDLDKAETNLNEVMNICKEYNLIDNFGKSNYLLGDINLKREKYSDAIMNYEKALYFFIKDNDRKNILKCHLNIGKVYIKENFYKGAINHFNFAEEVLNESQIEEIELYKELYSNIAKCYIKLDRPEKSIEYIDKINRLDIKNNEKEELDNLILKANNLLDMGRYEESKENFKKILEILEQKENKNALANVYLTISDIYKTTGQNEKSLEYSQKVYEIKKHDEDENMMNGLFRIIQIYMDDKEFEKAKKYCKIALASSIKNKNKFNEYKVLKFYADMSKIENENDKAIEYLNKCISIVSEIEDKKILANLYIELGQLYSEISKDKELEYYQKGVSMYKNLQII